jgi:hypothetical protein
MGCVGQNGVLEKIALAELLPRRTLPPRNYLGGFIIKFITKVPKFLHFIPMEFICVNH